MTRSYVVGYAVAVLGLALMLASLPTLVWAPVYAAGAALCLVPLAPPLWRQARSYGDYYVYRWFDVAPPR